MSTATGKKKSFKSGIEGLIRTKEEQQEQNQKYNIQKDNIKFVSTSINADPELIKQFKIALLKIEKPIYAFLEKSVDEIIIDKTIHIPHIKDEPHFTKYSFRIFKESREKLKMYSIERNLKVKDVCIYLMQKLIKNN